jgi:SLOG in TRPM, prokaryote
VRPVELTREEDIPGAVAALGLASPRPVVVVVGGAAGLDTEDAGLDPLGAGIVRAAERCGAVIVDGGTDSGVMRLIGRAAGGRVPLVGVVVRALAGLPDRPLEGRQAPLEPHHSHFVLVPGSSWGDEAPWISRLAGAIAGEKPSVTVLVNGGEIAWTDVAESVSAGRPVLAVAGTGRTADALVAALADGPKDDRAARLVATGLVLAVGSGAGLSDLVERRIEQFLLPGGTAA